MKSPKPSGAIVKSEADPAKVHQVYTWILGGGTEHDVRDAVAKEWPGDDATPLIVAAVLKFEKAAQFDRDVLRGWCFEAYRDLYRRMVEVGDFAGALKAIKLIADFAAS